MADTNKHLNHFNNEPKQLNDKKIKDKVLENMIQFENNTNDQIQTAKNVAIDSTDQNSDINQTDKQKQNYSFQQNKLSQPQNNDQEKQQNRHIRLRRSQSYEVGTKLLFQSNKNNITNNPSSNSNTSCYPVNQTMYINKKRKKNSLKNPKILQSVISNIQLYLEKEDLSKLTIILKKNQAKAKQLKKLANNQSPKQTQRQQQQYQQDVKEYKGNDDKNVKRYINQEQVMSKTIQQISFYKENLLQKLFSQQSSKHQLIPHTLSSSLFQKVTQNQFKSNIEIFTGFPKINTNKQISLVYDYTNGYNTQYAKKLNNHEDSSSKFKPIRSISCNKLLNTSQIIKEQYNQTLVQQVSSSLKLDINKKDSVFSKNNNNINYKAISPIFHSLHSIKNTKSYPTQIHFYETQSPSKKTNKNKLEDPNIFKNSIYIRNDNQNQELNIENQQKEKDKLKQTKKQKKKKKNIYKQIMFQIDQENYNSVEDQDDILKQLEDKQEKLYSKNIQYEYESKQNQGQQDLKEDSHNVDRKKKLSYNGDDNSDQHKNLNQIQKINDELEVQKKNNNNNFQQNNKQYMNIIQDDNKKDKQINNNTNSNNIQQKHTIQNNEKTINMINNNKNYNADYDQNANKQYTVQIDWLQQTEDQSQNQETKIDQIDNVLITDNDDQNNKQKKINQHYNNNINSKYNFSQHSFYDKEIEQNFQTIQSQIHDEWPIIYENKATQLIEIYQKFETNEKKAILFHIFQKLFRKCTLKYYMNEQVQQIIQNLINEQFSYLDGIIQNLIQNNYQVFTHILFKFLDLTKTIFDLKIKNKCFVYFFNKKAKQYIKSDQFQNAVECYKMCVQNLQETEYEQIFYWNFQIQKCHGAQGNYDQKLYFCLICLQVNEKMNEQEKKNRKLKEKEKQDFQIKEQQIFLGFIYQQKGRAQEQLLQLREALQSYKSAIKIFKRYKIYRTINDLQDKCLEIEQILSEDKSYCSIF